MTREEARKAAEVMMAYADGKDIEFKIKGEGRWQTWNKEYSLGFDFDGLDYRIKKEQEREPIYRPFGDREECWQEMQKHQPFGWTKYKSNGEFFCITYLCNETDFIDAYEKLTFADGTPFGKKRGIIMYAFFQPSLSVEQEELDIKETIDEEYEQKEREIEDYYKQMEEDYYKQMEEDYYKSFENRKEITEE